MTRYYPHALITFFTVFVIGCTTVPKPPEPVTQPDIPEEKAYVCARNTWCNAFSDAVKKAVTLYGKELLAANPTDYAKYCGTAGKLDCYNAILHAMSVYESGIDPNQVYVESFSDAKGNKVRSVGLLQVSIESCRSYGASATTTEELLKPEKNLECSVRILNRWIPKDGVIAGGSIGAWKGAARYWSVMRKRQSEIREKALGYLK